jgi:hypothetical protein
MGHLVIWCILPRFGIFYQPKSGLPDLGEFFLHWLKFKLGKNRPKFPFIRLQFGSKGAFLHVWGIQALDRLSNNIFFCGIYLLHFDFNFAADQN